MVFGRKDCRVMNPPLFSGFGEFVGVPLDLRQAREAKNLVIPNVVVYPGSGDLEHDNHHTVLELIFIGHCPFQLRFQAIKAVMRAVRKYTGKAVFGGTGLGEKNESAAVSRALKAINH